MSGRLFFLDLGGGRILSVNADGSDLKTILNHGGKWPDGLALDAAAGHIYCTNMGDPERNDCSIMRADLNGKNMITIMPPGGTFRPKRLQLEKRGAPSSIGRTGKARRYTTSFDPGRAANHAGSYQRGFNFRPVQFARITRKVTVVKDATASYSD